MPTGSANCTLLVKFICAEWIIILLQYNGPLIKRTHCLIHDVVNSKVVLLSWWMVLCRRHQFTFVKALVVVMLVFQMRLPSSYVWPTELFGFTTDCVFFSPAHTHTTENVDYNPASLMFQSFQFTNPICISVQILNPSSPPPGEREFSVTIRNSDVGGAVADNPLNIFQPDRVNITIEGKTLF